MKLPEVIADHMVIQRNKPVNIFGTANPGEKISVNFAGKTVATTTAKDGKWIVQLPAQKASATGRPITIKGENTITIKDVLVGEVWHANGQSNMAWTLKQCGGAGQPVLAKSNNAQIRFYNRQRIISPKPVYNEKQLEILKNKAIYAGGWEISAQQTAPKFSAVALIFAQKMHEELKVPIGILHTAAGGSPTEAFISNETLMANKRTAALVKNWPYSKECSTPQAAKNFKNALKPGEKIVFGKFPYHHPWEPSILFDMGVKSLMPYTINGAIWYQGETNQKNPDLHNLLFPMMVRDWRKHWGLGDFPVYYVQLPSVNRPTWPEFRDGQRKFVTAEPNIGMAVTIDTADVRRKTNVHPADKVEVGNRLAYLALENVFKGNKVLATGPLVKEATAKGSEVTVHFDYAEGLQAVGNKPLEHFELAGADGAYVKATPTIKGSTLVLTSSVKAPKSVRYAWNPFPMPRPNFGNKHGHIASPFEINISK
ncbi:sialate O-acetylesterase [Rubritalea tangerina]|uniref:Sialate O-acetylesterase n=1 Tax=Rubritalea tangerina TaxID=430798 RepID=A0ABW4ZDY1_9BACT